MTESDGTQNWASIKDQQDAAEFFHSFMNVLRDEAASTQEARVLLDQMFKISITQEFLCSGQPTEGCPAQKTRPLVYYGYLPIPAEKSNSVEDSLNTLFGKETNVNKKCAHCPREVGSMLTTLATVPEILIIQLQRFRGGNNRAEKITRMITVPNTLRPQPDGQNYDLEFVVCHKGNLMEGHYVSLVKCPTSGVIYKVDDHHAVTRYLPSESDKQTGQAYMMMYKKQSDTVPSVIDDQLPARKKPRLSSQDEPSTSGLESRSNRCQSQETLCHTDPITIDAQFESLMEKMSPAWMDRIIDRLGMKRQNGYKRREQHLNTYFTKNTAHQQRIINVIAVTEISKQRRYYH